MATQSELIERATEIKDETEGAANTADRVGSLLVDMILSAVKIYDPGSRYGRGEYVIFSDGFYRSLASIEVGETPALMPDKWRAVSAKPLTLAQVTANGGNETDDGLFADRYYNPFFGGQGAIDAATMVPALLRLMKDDKGRDVLVNDYTTWDEHLRTLLSKALNTTLNDAFIQITQSAQDAFVREFTERQRVLTPETLKTVSRNGHITDVGIGAVDFHTPIKPPHNIARGFAGWFPSGDRLLVIELSDDVAGGRIVRNLQEGDKMALAAQLAPYLNIGGTKTIIDFDIVGDESADEGTVKLYTAKAIYSDGSTGVLTEGYTWGEADSFNVPTAQFAPLSDDVQGNTYQVPLLLTYQIPGQAQPTTKTKLVTRRDVTPVPVSTNGIAARLTYDPATYLLETEIDPKGVAYFHRYARKDGVPLVGSNPDQIPLESGTWYGFGDLLSQEPYTHQGRFGRKSDGTGGIPPGTVIVLSFRRETDGLIFSIEYQTPRVDDGLITRRQVCTAAPVSVVSAPVFNGSLPSLPAMTEGKFYEAYIPKSSVDTAPGHEIVQIFASGVPSYLSFVQLSPDRDEAALRGTPPDGALSPTIVITWGQDDGQNVQYSYPISVLDASAPPSDVITNVSEDTSGGPDDLNNDSLVDEGTSPSASTNITAVDFAWQHNGGMNSNNAPAMQIWIKIDNPGTVQGAVEILEPDWAKGPKSGYSNLNTGDYGNGYTKLVDHYNVPPTARYRLYLRRAGETADSLVLDLPKLPANGNVARTTVYTNSTGLSTGSASLKQTIIYPSARTSVMDLRVRWVDGLAEVHNNANPQPENGQSYYWFINGETAAPAGAFPVRRYKPRTWLLYFAGMGPRREIRPDGYINKAIQYIWVGDAPSTTAQ